MATRFASVMLVLLAVAACDSGNGPERHVISAVGGIKPVRDARTGLCFVYSSLRGGTVTGLSNVSCELVAPAIERNAREGRRVVSHLKYGWMIASGGNLCFGYVDDDAGNLRSNFAVVPCDPVQQANERSGVPFDLFWP